MSVHCLFLISENINGWPATATWSTYLTNKRHGGASLIN